MSLEGSQVLAIAEISPAARSGRKGYPGHSSDCRRIGSDRLRDIDAIAIVSPVWTHYELTKAASRMASTSSSRSRSPALLPGRRTNQSGPAEEPQNHGGPYISLYRCGEKICQLIDEGALGKLYYYDSTRVNLGLFQHDINVLWDLAPHDLSIMDHLIKASPEAVVATGQDI